jgi:hypothetical protein
MARPLRFVISTDPDAGRHAKRLHPVDHIACDFCLGPLIGQSAGLETPAMMVL